MYCDVCTLNYAADDKTDRREHSRRHKNWLAASAAGLTLPGDRDMREAMKNLGREVIGMGDPASLLAGGRMLCLGWFQRSLALSITAGTWSQHPSFADYVRGLDLSAMVDPPVEAALRREYGAQVTVVGLRDSHWCAW